MTITLIDTINMYPSIKLKTIKKAVIIFSKGLTTAIKKVINLLLEIIHFRIYSTLIDFYGKYYEYHGGVNKEQGLAIGGYT